MKKKKNLPPKKMNQTDIYHPLEDSLDFQADIIQLKNSIDGLRNHIQKLEEKIQDAEIHVNLLTRLLTTLCIEKFGMRVGVLKRLIKRIESEAIRDSQIFHLESLYKLSADLEKRIKTTPTPPKDDPWEEIS
ncbi:MAG: hypothetical protein NC930_05980 [Candidatus Omnitrophica bacterium]|nr:hypothetical protein [Candidatus Omnitrophota bacterium]